jgi:hypothetical protein
MPPVPKSIEHFHRARNSGLTQAILNLPETNNIHFRFFVFFKAKNLAYYSTNFEKKAFCCTYHQQIYYNVQKLFVICYFNK